MRRIGIGLLGLGTVGSGVARLLTTAEQRLAARARGRLELRSVLVRNLERPREVRLPTSTLLTSDAARILDDPEIEIIVEVLGGTDVARELVLQSLRSGKHVVTANKALLAEHGPEILSTARAHDRAVAFEAAVGGGIPIVQALAVGLAANQVLGLSAILNGTCNFILTKMAGEAMSYDDALAEAQTAGFAEPDPTLDVDGTDTAHKLAILAQLAFGASVRMDEIPRRGIDSLQVDDIRFAAELGFTVKLLARARLTENGLELRVAPRLVMAGTPLADVQGAYNAIRVVGDAVGDTLFYGPGAGSLPTASAIIGDVIDVAVGRAVLTSRVLNLWGRETSSPQLTSPEHIRSRYYLRFSIADRPGVLGMIAQILGKHGVSIASVIQRDPGESGPNSPVALVIMTHVAVEAELMAALAEIDGLEAVVASSVCLGVEDRVELNSR